MTTYQQSQNLCRSKFIAIIGTNFLPYAECQMPFISGTMDVEQNLSDSIWAGKPYQLHTIPFRRKCTKSTLICNIKASDSNNILCPEDQYFSTTI